MASGAHEPRLPRIDVCIASYKRPEGLRRLLDSLLAQETDGKFTFAIHVADNDARRSAEPVVREAGSAGRPISYCTEPVQNISLARNRAIALATGDYIATIDDDTWAEPRWLLTLHEAAVRHGADGVFGPSVPVLAPGTPEYIGQLLAFPDPPTGSESGFVPSTASFLFKRALIDGVAEPFDPRFGRTGGEDTDLFNRLRARGCRLIWCREAVAHAPVAPERASIRYILRRRFRCGNGDSERDRPFLRVLGPKLQSILILAPISAAYLLAGVFHRPSRVKAQARLIRMLGHGAFLAGFAARKAGFLHEEYKE